MGKNKKSQPPVKTENTEVKEEKNDFRFDVLTKGQLSKEKFRKDKLGKLDDEADKIAEEGIAAIDGGGEVYVGYIGNEIALMYIFTKSESEDGSTFEMTAEYENFDIETPQFYDAMEEHMFNVLTPLAATYDRVIFKDNILQDVPERATNYSFLGSLIGFALMFLLFGVVIGNYLVGTVLGITFAVLFGIVFSSAENAQKAAGIGEENIESRKLAQKKS